MTPPALGGQPVPPPPTASACPQLPALAPQPLVHPPVSALFTTFETPSFILYPFKCIHAIPPWRAGTDHWKVVVCPRRGSDPASGHPGAQKPPLGRGPPPLVWALPLGRAWPMMANGEGGCPPPCGSDTEH